MFYRLLADIIVFLHLLWIGFLIFGATVGWKVGWIAILHGLSLIFSILLQLFDWVCPLTHLEQWLRAKGGWTYSGDFIQHYVEKLVYLDVSRTAVFLGTMIVVVGSALLYWKSYLAGR